MRAASHPRPPAGALDEFVAFDLETTGLDPVEDRITEVGATRFRPDGEATTFQSFVNPGRAIPPQVVELTGIDAAAVAGAPTITAVGAQLAAFAGGRPLVGHNLQFDLDFLHAAGVELAGTPFDTLELASVLLPTATRLDLGSLAEQLGVAVDQPHRALPDAEVTRDVFLRLLGLLERLPAATLRDLLAIAESAAWQAAELFADALARTPAGVPAGEPRAALSLPAPPAPLPALEPRDARRAVTADEVASVFAAAAREPPIEGFEPRPGQLRMAQAVARNLASGGQLAVEGGTGVGKSLAYLVPALLHAARNDDRVVVSTHTLNLQEQLAQRDIPVAAGLVERAEGLAPGSLHAAVLKGRANYLCLERWTEAREGTRERTRAEARLHARITLWLGRTPAGDVAELRLSGDERPAWRALSADGTDCLARRCSFVREGSCFLLRARQRAAAAHVVVVNHALLLADASGVGQALPPFRQLVVDEAHRLEDVATQRYGASLSLRELSGRLDTMRGREGVAGRLRAATTADPAPLSPAAGLSAGGEAVGAAAERARERIPTLERLLRAYVDERADDLGGGTAREVALGSARRSQPLWEEVEEAAIQLDVTLLYLGERIEQSRRAVAALPAGGATPAAERLEPDLAREGEALAAARATLGEVVLRDDPALIAWLEPGEQDVRLQLAPLDVAPRLQEDLYAGCDSVTATSATLSAGGSFDFSLRALGLEEAERLDVPAPFDYRRAALAIAVSDLPEPNAPAYAVAAYRTLAQATEAAGGRTVALFTSHAAVRAAAAELRGYLGARGISVLAQDIDGSPARLLRALTERPRTLLLGTAAFWEGVDVRGQALSQIAVARLPFPVPTEPVYAGRAQQYEDPFGEYALPRAVLRFRQGFGRLIRGGDERGVFLVLDSRIVSRDYGAAFIDALPDLELRQLPASAVAEAVAGWLAR